MKERKKERNNIHLQKKLKIEEKFGKEEEERKKNRKKQYI